MKRELVIRPAAVDEQAAAWILATVLVRTRKNGRPCWAGPDLGSQVGVRDDPCPCLYGICGVCKDLGRHDRCSHRLGRSPRPDGHETWLISRGGAALTGVWVRQVFDGEWKPCDWVCACLECEQLGPAAVVVDGLPPARRRADGQQALF